MGLRKGQTNNINGRPKGSVNSTTKELRQMLIDIFFDIEEMQSDFEELDARERLYLRKELAPFIMPKLQAQAIIDGSEPIKKNFPPWFHSNVEIDFRDAE
jgi:hypothetical protein